MKCDIFTIVQPFQFIAHMFKQQSVLLGVYLKSSFQQPKIKKKKSYKFSIIFDFSTLIENVFHQSELILQQKNKKYRTRAIITRSWL